MKKTPNKGNRYLTWVLRILLILMILFWALFSLDVFEGEQGFWNILVAFLMHNIPVFVMIFILIIAWKWEHIGGITFNVVYTRIYNFSYCTLWKVYVWHPNHGGNTFFDRCNVCC